MLYENGVKGLTDVVAFSDASWQDCPDTGRSTTGHLIFYQGGIVAASSNVPTPVAMSSAEAEYMAAAGAGMTAAAIRMLIYDLKYLGTNKEYKHYDKILSSTPVILCVDNSAAVAMAKSHKFNKKSRHIARHFHFVRQGVDDGLHEVTWVSKNVQLADIMTKTQPASKIDPHLPYIIHKLPEHLSSMTTKGDKLA
jgi:hypothetical protein